MPRLRQIPREKAHPAAQQLYQALFGDRDVLFMPVVRLFSHKGGSR